MDASDKSMPRPTWPGRARRVYVALVAGNVLLCSGLYLLVPALRPQFTEEDRALEMFTAFALLGAALVGGAALVRRGLGGGNGVAAPIPLLALAGFFDEMSDFLILRGYYRPIDLWGDPRYRIDAVHDVFALGFKLWRDFVPAGFDVLLVLLLGGGTALAFLKRRAYMPAVMAAIRRRPCLDYFRFAVILIGAAMVLDLDFIEGTFFEEMLEANGALALLFAAFLMHWPPLADGAERNACPGGTNALQ